MQIFVTLVLLAIVASLVRAMVHMGQADEGGGMVRALTARVVLSIALFGFLMLSWHLGWIQPHIAH
ncbi:MAG TPA: DUF2909 domain-containing protein [Steroidobacteraceae bacterium]|jgi:hypothetical protein|nr:DUF2909 domain-containing protein [Steroidobacteraceae bacterium]